jgi:hypothetical protein
MDKITVTKFKIKFLYAVGNILDPDPEGIRIHKFVDSDPDPIPNFLFCCFAGSFCLSGTGFGFGRGWIRIQEDIDQKIKRNIMS